MAGKMKKSRKSGARKSSARGKHIITFGKTRWQCKLIRVRAFGRRAQVSRVVCGKAAKK